MYIIVVRNVSKNHGINIKFCVHQLQHLKRKKKDNRNILQDKSFPTHLSPKEKAKMAKIVGEKCLMQCELSGAPKSVLLDTSAQVSIISEKYLLENFINAEIRAILDILDGHDSLRVQWGNNSEQL